MMLLIQVVLIPYAKGTCSDGDDLGVGKTSIGKKIDMPENANGRLDYDITKDAKKKN